MAGTYIEGSSKPLSGVYTLILAAVSGVSMGTRGVVAYPFTSDWGPVNALTPIAQGGEFKNLYNADKTALTAAKIYKHAYKGLPQKLLAYRMSTGEAKGTCSLGATSLQLETLYPSARAFSAVVKDDAVTGGKTIDIVESGVKLLSVTAGTNADLAAKLNVSDYVRVTSVGADLPVNSAGVAFAGGNNGSAVTVTQYSAFLDELEADGTAGSFSLDGVSDDAIITVVTDWIKRVRTEGLYTVFVNGGPAAWDTDGGAAANAKSVSLNHRGIVNVGNGCDGYTAAEMAIFIAARVASIALNRTVTDETVPYTALNKKLKPGQRITAKEKGTLVFVAAGDFVEIDEGINTLTAPPADESAEFGKIRINNALDAISKDLEAFGNTYKKSKSNTQEARETYAATVENSYLRPLAAMEVIQDGYFYRPDPEYHGKTAVFSPKIDEAFFYADVTPVDSMERIYQKINVNF